MVWVCCGNSVLELSSLWGEVLDPCIVRTGEFPSSRASVKHRVVLYKKTTGVSVARHLPRCLRDSVMAKTAGDSQREVASCSFEMGNLFKQDWPFWEDDLFQSGASNGEGKLYAWSLPDVRGPFDAGALYRAGVLTTLARKWGSSASGGH